MLPSLTAKHAKVNRFKWLYIEWQKREIYVYGRNQSECEKANK